MHCTPQLAMADQFVCFHCAREPLVKSIFFLVTFHWCTQTWDSLEQQEQQEFGVQKIAAVCVQMTALQDTLGNNNRDFSRKIHGGGDDKNSCSADQSKSDSRILQTLWTQIRNEECVVWLHPPYELSGGNSLDRRPVMLHFHSRFPGLFSVLTWTMCTLNRAGAQQAVGIMWNWHSLDGSNAI